MTHATRLSSLLVILVACLSSCENCALTPHALHSVGSPGGGTCTFDLDCPDGLACESSECTPICEGDADCGGERECREGVNTEQTICRDSEAPSTDVGGDADRGDASTY